MDEFEIPLTYKGIDREFSAKVLHLGYIFKIQVVVDKVVVLFELDENRQFRGILSNPEVDVKHIDKELMETIAQTLDSLLGP
jgi:hypothetical protein